MNLAESFGLAQASAGRGGSDPADLPVGTGRIAAASGLNPALQVTSLWRTAQRTRRGRHLRPCLLCRHVAVDLAEVGQITVTVEQGRLGEA